MGRIFEAIDRDLSAWIAKQAMYFVGTAPLSEHGHVNVSPKGSIDTFRVLDDRRVAYLDFVGSGIETIAHLRENGRIVIMFCAFDGPPKIVRLHGRGNAIHEGEDGFIAVSANFLIPAEQRPCVRSVIVVEVERISDSCGFGVPRMQVVEERDQMVRWAAQKSAANGSNWKQEYMCEKNLASVDGLPGLELERLLAESSDSEE